MVLFLGLAGIGGGASSDCPVLGRGGILGLGGILGGASLSTGGCPLNCSCPLGADFVVVRTGIWFALLTISLSPLSLFEGGKGGNFASPKAGGNFLSDPTLETLVIDPFCPNDIPDIVELNEELDALRTTWVSGVNCVDVLRGGRFGDGCDALREGRGGGPLRAGKGGVPLVNKRG